MTNRILHPTSLAKCILIGGSIALTLIVFFLAALRETDPAWPEYWMVRPLIIVPMAGACGGLCYYLLDNLRVEGGWRKMLANVLSLLVYIIGLWMGFILGLVGTLWN